jgi:hypothetical protein
MSDRSALFTTVILCDGLGSGIKANVSATACGHRLIELLRSGFSPRAAFDRVIPTMNEARGADLPFAAFSLLRIMGDGAATVLLYEMPDPILLDSHQASVLATRKRSVEGAVVAEVNCHLRDGEGILSVSDGITQAGIGGACRDGWGIEEACRFLTARIEGGGGVKAAPRILHDQARALWGAGPGDDCSAVLSSCRIGRDVVILTGPPADRALDRDVVVDLLGREGSLVVCGGTTAGIVARVRGMEVEVEPDTDLGITPPRYHLQGMDLVTEGAITLNQLYNIWDEDPAGFEECSAVTDLLVLLKAADRVTIIQGGARNPASQSVAFRQQGILDRERILPLLAERMRAEGKLVLVERV